MADPRAFSRVQFYIAIGRSVLGNRYCVFVDTNPPPDTKVLNPQKDRKYIVHTLFKFFAPRKTPYNMIITNLKYAGVFPDGKLSSFQSPINPDNKFYTDLLESDLQRIISVITLSLNGLTINTNLQPDYEVIVTPELDLYNACRREHPALTLDNPLVVVLGSGGRSTYSIHNFSRTHTSEPFSAPYVNDIPSDEDV